MKTSRWLIIVILLTFISANSCLPGPPESGGGRFITLYGFSIMKEVLEKDIYPAFEAKWKAENGGESLSFTSSYAGSEFITNQILQGTPADVAILSIERDAQRLAEGNATTTDWHAYPQKGIINKTPFVILVRAGNPLGIKDFSDLAKPGVKLIHPDPVSSGGAQWSILAIYGSELVKSKAKGSPDTARALQTLQGVWANVISTPGSAREARTQFETGYGDALITYELEGLLMQDAGEEVDIVVPSATIFSEHPVVIIDRNMGDVKRPAVEAFIRYLWTDEAQKAFVKYYFRSVTNESFNDANPKFAKIEMPFTIELFGGWERATPEIIEGVFRRQVLKK